MKTRHAAMKGRLWATAALGVGLAAVPSGAVWAAGLRIVPVDPVPGAHVSSQRPTIEFEIHTADNASVNRRQVKVTLDGDDASRDLQIAGSRLEIIPHGQLSLGAHQIDVSIEDTTGERATDHWTFTVDSSDAAVPTVRDDTSASDNGSSYDNGYNSNADSGYGGGYGPGGGYGYNGGYGYGGYGYNGAFGLPYGYYPGSGAFFPVGYGPYYYGEPLRFIYSGLGLGGFVTIGGFPGSYPLVPFAPNYYFVTVPVPSNYNGGTPIATCHFPNHRRYLLSTKPVTVEHAHRPAGSRSPAWMSPHWRPTLSTLATLPGTPSAVRAFAERAAMGGLPSRSASSGPVIVRYGSTAPSRGAEPGMVRIVPPRGNGMPHVAPVTPRTEPFGPHVFPAPPHVAPPLAPRFVPAAPYAMPAPIARPGGAPASHAAPAPAPAAPARGGATAPIHH